MLSDRNHSKIRLVSATQQIPIEGRRPSTFPLPGESEFPGPPALPHALLRLELSLSPLVINLQDVTNIIKSDVGLTVQLLRLAARQSESSRSETSSINIINETAIQVGVDGLRALVAQTKPVPDNISRACERFWTHSRLIALIAAEIAGQSTEITAEEAYLAGLLCHLGDLPSILGWAGSGKATSRHNGYRMAKAWEFPNALTEVIGGYGEVCPTPESCALLDLAEAADNWASRLEFLAARAVMRSDFTYRRAGV
jgi:HD-like signal output (HDOD) protein